MISSSVSDSQFYNCLNNIPKLQQQIPYNSKQKMISHPNLKRNTEQTNKEQLFRFFHKLLFEYKISPLLFAFLILLQTLQIMYFAIHRSCCMLWDVDGLRIVQNVLGFVSGSLVWVLGGDSVGLGFNVMFFVVGAVAIGVIGYQVRNGKPSQLTLTNNFHQIRIKFMQYYSILLRTVLTIPLSSLFLYTITSFQDSSTSVNIVSLVFTSLSFLTYSILLYLFLELFIDNSPFSKFSLSGPITLNQKYKTAIKFVVGIVSGLLPVQCSSSDDNIHLIFLIVMMGGFVYLSYLNYTQANLVNNLVRKVSQHSNITLITLFILILIQKLITPNQKITLLWMIIICILANFSWARVKRAKQNKLIYSVYKSLSTKEEILAYNYLMCQLIRDFYKDPLCLVKLQGILTDHLLNCKKLDEVCKCRILRKKIKNFGYENDRVQAELEAPHWFQFLKYNLVFNTEKMSHLPQFYLFLSYVQKEILANNFVSYANLEKCSNKKTTLNIQFLIYHEKRIIQRTLLQEDEKNNEKKQVDVNKFIEMSDTVDRFHEKVLKSSIENLDFWKALTSRKKNKQIIMKQGSRLLETVKQCEQIYRSISQKYPHNLESIVLFSNYSKYILNNHEQIVKNRTLFNLIKKKLFRSIKISSQQEKQKYSENSITASIIISGKKSNIGIIKACSSKVTKILKYAPYELIGQNINTIMPVFLGHLHNDVLINYLDLAESHSNFVQRLAPMVDKNNFMILGRIMTKPVPCLINGLQLIGVLQRIRQNNIRHMNQNPKYMLYRCDNGNVEALSQNFHTYYGYRLMKVNQMYEICQQLNFSTVFQGITNNDIKDCEEGHDCMLKVKKSIKKLVRVKVYVRMEFVYFGTKVRLLSVYTSTEGSFNTMMLPGGVTTINQGNQGALLSEQKSSQHSGNGQTAAEQQNQNQKSHEVLSEQQLKQLQNKVPIKFRVFQVIVILFIISLLALSSLQFYQNIGQINAVKSYLEHSQYLSNSLIYLINIGYYIRMMQLSATYPQVLGNFQEYQANVSIYTDNLQKSQFWLVNKQAHIKDTINFNYPDLPLSWLIAQQNNIYSKQTSLNLHIFDLITSSSSFSSSNATDFNFDFVLTQDKNAQDNAYFRNLFRVRYSSLFELIPAKLKYSSTLFTAYKTTINQYFHLSYIQIGVASGLVLVFLAIGLKILYMILRSIFSITSLFNWLTPSQIEKQIQRCETFLEHFFMSSYEVVVRAKRQQILRGHSFEQTHHIQKSNNQLMRSNKQMFLEEEVDNAEPKNDYDKTAEIDIAEIQQKQIKDKESQGKVGQNGQESCPLKTQQQLQENDKQEENNQSIFFGNPRTFLPLVLYFFLVLFYFIGMFLYSQACDAKTLTQLRNQDLIYLNIQTLDMLKYYGLQSTIDPTAFKSYPNLKNTFLNISYNIYKYQQKLNDAVEKEGQNHRDSNSLLSQILKSENGDNVCVGGFKQNNIYSGTSFSLNQCQSIDNGVLNQGLRASIVAYIQNIKNTTKQPTPDKLVASTSFTKSLLLVKYIKNSLQRISEKNRNNVSDYMSTQLIISVIFFSIFVVYGILIGIFISFRIGNELRMKILGTSQIISLIPQRIFQRNVNLCSEYRKNVKQLLQ